MLNPGTATHTLTERDTAPAVSASDSSDDLFAPLFTRTVKLAIATVEDELGRPLLGGFVTDGELL